MDKEKEDRMLARINRLDYSQALKISTLWIPPMIMSNQDDNGYPVIGFKQVDSLFGIKEQGEQLIDEDHERGLKVIYDYPLP